MWFSLVTVLFQPNFYAVFLKFQCENHFNYSKLLLLEVPLM
jgi:hypothetical protein